MNYHLLLRNGLLLFSLFTLGTPVWAAEELSGKVVFVDGEVTANGRVTDTGDLLVGPTILKTGKASTLEVVFAGKNIFRLGADTTVKIDFAQLKKTVSLEKGVFTSVLKKLAQASGSASFLLKTPTSNAGVRGTSFHVSTDGTTTYFCTCNGRVDLDNTQAQQVQLTNAHHGARIFSRQTDGTVSVSTAGMEGHTDASIETLARRIAVAVDWTQPDLKHE